MKYLLYILKLPSQTKGFKGNETLTACVELSQLNIVISATRGFEWTVGKNFAQVKKWIEENKELLKRWNEMGFMHDKEVKKNIKQEPTPKVEIRKTFTPTEQEELKESFKAEGMLDVYYKEFPPMPTIICLCGSTRFHDLFEYWGLEETLAGCIVLNIATTRVHDDALNLSPQQAIEIRELHLRKIDLCDEILVINKGGYVGETTSDEILYAQKKGKKIRFIEPIAKCFSLSPFLDKKEQE